MKKMLSSPLLFLAVLILPALPGFSQTWHKEVTNSSAYFSKRFLHSSMLQAVQIKSMVVGPDKRVYTTGFFSNSQANFGSIVIVADSFLRPVYTPGSDALYMFSSFVACQDSTGNFLWAKTLGSSHERWFGHNNPGTNSGQKIVVDASGNVYVGVSMVSDTLRVNDQDLLFSSTSRCYPGLVKLSPAGDLLWSRFFTSPDPGNPVNWLNLQVRNGLIEGVLEHSSLAWNGAEIFPMPTSFHPYSFGKVKFTPTGAYLGGNNFHFTSAEYDGGLSMACELLKDGTVLLSTLPAQALPIYITHLDTAMNILTTRKFRFIQSNGDASTGFSWIRKIQPLNDGGFGIFMMNYHPGVNKIISGTDTLTIPQGFFYLRLEGQSCMKVVRSLPRTFQGEIHETPDGNLLATNFTETTTWNPNINPVVILRINQNGSLADTINMGFEAENYIQIPSSFLWRFPTFQILPHGNNKMLCVTGSHIFQFVDNALAAIDSSFTGCLSDRAIFLANPKIDMEKVPQLAGNPVQDFVRFDREIKNTSFRVINTLGQVLQSGRMGSQEVYVGNLPHGIYQIQLLDTGGSKTMHRFEKL